MLAITLRKKLSFGLHIDKMVTKYFENFAQDAERQAIADPNYGEKGRLFELAAQNWVKAQLPLKAWRAYSKAQSSYTHAIGSLGKTPWDQNSAGAYEKSITEITKKLEQLRSKSGLISLLGKSSDLLKVPSTLAVASITALFLSIFFLSSNFTGHVIAETVYWNPSGLIGIFFLIICFVLAFSYFRNKK